jgi:hypothetical protein
VDYAPSSNAGGDAAAAAFVMPNPYARRERVFLVDDAAKLVEGTDSSIIAATFDTARTLVVPTELRRFTLFPTADRLAMNTGV